jgi:hypothetical protein
MTKIFTTVVIIVRPTTVVMLFAGIGILMKPTSLVPSSSETVEGQPADNNPTLKAVITLGSGFLIAREDKPEQEQNRT